MAEQGGPPERIRVELGRARRGRDARRVREDLTEQTGVGDALLRGLIRAQLSLALRLAVVVAVGLGGLPLLFAVAPAVAHTTVAGIALPWLLLGVASFPALVAVGWAYVRMSERNERDFTDLVER